MSGIQKNVRWQMHYYHVLFLFHFILFYFYFIYISISNIVLFCSVHKIKPNTFSFFRLCNRCTRLILLTMICHFFFFFYQRSTPTSPFYYSHLPRFTQPNHTHHQTYLTHYPLSFSPSLLITKPRIDGKDQYRLIEILA